MSKNNVRPVPVIKLPDLPSDKPDHRSHHHTKLTRRPKFCPPFTEGDASAWLKNVATSLLDLCETNQKRYLAGIDAEVIGALYLARELQRNSDLHKAWCELPEWVTIKNKRPKVGKTSSAVAEVFRFVWAIQRGDEDAYQLRYKAVAKHHRDTLSPEEIVNNIRRAGGYKKSARLVPRSVTQGNENEISPSLSHAASVGATTGKSEGANDRDDAMSWSVNFDVHKHDLRSVDGCWSTWHVYTELDAKIMRVDRIDAD